MIFGVGLLAAVYAGSKSLPEDHVINQTIKKIAAEVRRCLTDISDTDKPVEPKTDEKLKEEKLISYSDASLITTTLFALKGVNPLLGPLGLCTYSYAMMPHMRDVEKSLVKENRVNVDSLFMFADVLAILTGNFLTAGLSLVLIHSGKLAVMRAKNESKNLVQHLFKELPTKVRILKDGIELQVPLEELVKGDTIVLHSGDVVPADGVISLGVAEINQQALTGESILFEKAPGDDVFANTIVVSGRILVRVERSGSETTSHKIAETLFNSIEHKSQTQLKGEEWADKLTTPMFGSALLLLPVLGLNSTAVFLNSHIGVKIRILAPMGTLKYISIASQKGILVKDGRALENFIDIDTILFDKTGTLTYENPEVSDIIPVGRYSENEVLRYTAIAEQKLTHPIAKAVLKKASEFGIEIPDIDDSAFSIGYGIEVNCRNETIQVGSIRYMEDHRMRIPDVLRDRQEEALRRGINFIFVARNREVIGGLQLQSQIRSELKTVLKNLHKQGFKHLAIVSGDQQAPTKALADEIGMDDYYYNVLPEQKADIVEKLQRAGRKVCFVGDGINDSIALKKADVSISLAGASNIAQDMSDIILMKSNLTSINDMHQLSTELQKNLKRSLDLCKAPAVINLAGAFLLHFNMLTSLLVNGAFGMIGAYNILPVKQRKEDSAEEDTMSDLKATVIPDNDREDAGTAKPVVGRNGSHAKNKTAVIDII